MDFYEVIRSRRSCRVFKPDPVPREILERIVEAATWAPSGKNRQNYRVFVVTGKKKDALVSIADRSFPIIEPSLKEMYDETHAFDRDLLEEFTRLLGTSDSQHFDRYQVQSRYQSAMSPL